MVRTGQDQPPLGFLHVLPAGLCPEGRSRKLIRNTSKREEILKHSLLRTQLRSPLPPCGWKVLSLQQPSPTSRQVASGASSPALHPTAPLPPPPATQGSPSKPTPPQRALLPPPFPGAPRETCAPMSARQLSRGGPSSAENRNSVSSSPEAGTQTLSFPSSPEDVLLIGGEGET